MKIRSIRRRRGKGGKRKRFCRGMGKGEFSVVLGFFFHYCNCCGICFSYSMFEFYDHPHSPVSPMISAISSTSTITKELLSKISPIHSMCIHFQLLIVRFWSGNMEVLDFLSPRSMSTTPTRPGATETFPRGMKDLSKTSLMCLTDCGYYSVKTEKMGLVIMLLGVFTHNGQMSRQKSMV